ncbi:uncharacterized protein LOC131317246 [Rhododendron vialii]|uniref:uncharacterized protein LOC131317246 n=1 Tax=Rhododendron vialii TaxID=182163 RepID=UPI00265E8C81|nr:uncharacterized protein LOC131317246 [Rhododendron vialii]
MRVDLARALICNLGPTPSPVFDISCARVDLRGERLHIRLEGGLITMGVPTSLANPVVLGLFCLHKFGKFPWLEYSPQKDAVFCFPCFIFEKKTANCSTLTGGGFINWNVVFDAFSMHVGGPNSPHFNAVNYCDDLMNVGRHIDKVMNAQSSEDIQKNKLRLMAMIESIGWLTLQGCALRGHDESVDSKNRGNFIELIKFEGKLDDNIVDVVLEKAPKNAKYISPLIQKEILHIFGNKVRKKICEEVRDAKFCILVDEAKDASNREQMVIVLRFVDIQGFLQERFFHIVHVKNTTALTLKKEISDVLTRYNLDIHNILVDMFTATIKVLGMMFEKGSSNSIRGEAKGITYLLCRALQHKSLDIINAMDLVFTTKALFHTFREKGFDPLMMHVKSICTEYDIDMPNMSARYKTATGRTCQQNNVLTVEHHCHIDIFNAVIDFQLAELNDRFNKGVVELLVLSSTLEPKDGFKSFNVDHICTLAEKFYPDDFTNQQRNYLRL